MNIRFLALVKNAPPNFYSPCGNSTPLNLNEIETRACSYMVPSVTFKEMVFRKFLEVIQNYNEENFFYALQISYEFLKERNLSENEVDEITYQLEKELIELRNGVGRMEHNPF